MQDFTGAGRVQCVKELLPKCHQYGIRKLMVDTCVLDLASYGQAMSAMFDLKDELGLPGRRRRPQRPGHVARVEDQDGPARQGPLHGCGRGGHRRRRGRLRAYGPVEDARFVFPAAAMVDTAFSQLAMERGDDLDENHPRYRVG